MKLTIERAALSEALSLGGSLSPRVNTIPILGHARLIADGSRLQVSTTDIERQAVSRAVAEVARSGQVTVPSRALRDFVQRLPANAKSITIEADAAGSLIVKSGRNRAKLSTLDARDFPDLTVLASKGGARFEVSGADLKHLFGRVIVAASDEDTRYYLRGAYLHVVEGELRAIATNGHLLLKVSLPLPAGGENLPHTGLIVPTETIQAALKLFERAEMVSVSVTPSGIVFEAGETRFASKLIDGTYPDYQRVIPQSGRHKIELDRASCLTSLRLIEAFQDRGAGHAVECGHDADGLALAAGGAEGDSTGYAVASANYETPFPNFGVSSAYLRDALNAFHADVVTLAFEDPGAPIRVESDKDGGTLGVIMPMRISADRIALMREAA